ncbi:hypothetical protein SRABI106_02758 [Rahnella aquatilis]|nr:hypothetical protein SRABI106_02758 [Rahnella aquatilis]
MTVVIDLDFLISGAPMQNVFIVFFNALLTDIVVSRVILSDTLRLEAFGISVVYLRNITHNMRQFRTVRITALLIGADRDAGEIKLIDGKTRHFNIRQRQLQRDLRKATSVDHRIVKTVQIVLCQIDNGFQRIQRGVEIRHFSRDDFNLVQGDILRQHDTVAIHDQPATGRDRQHFDVILIRAGLIKIMHAHLQVIQVKHQRRRQEDHHHKCDHGTTNEKDGLGSMVADFVVK